MSELAVSEGFIIAMFAGLSALIAGVLACALKSRCSRIKCGCIECDRDVIPVASLNNVRVDIPTPQPPAQPVE